MKRNINEVHIRKIIQCECYHEIRCEITSEDLAISGKTYRVNRPNAGVQKNANRVYSMGM